MAFHLTIQSAPERKGDVGAATTGTWSGGSTPTSSGTYTGPKNKTFTFTVDDAGTVATDAMTVDWTDGEGNGSRLHIPTTYTAGDKLQVFEGVIVEFGAGTLVEDDDFTVAVVARNKVRPDHFKLTGTADPLDISPVEFGTIDHDQLLTAHDGRISRLEIAQTQRIRVFLDYARDTEKRLIEELRKRRHPVLVYGNCDRHTVFWYPGSGRLPTIGTELAWTRASAQAYRDPGTGLYKSAASGEIAYGPGVEEASRDETNDWDRMTIPLSQRHIGKAVIVGEERTNLIPQSHSYSGDLVWTANSGSPDITWDTSCPPVMDPDDDTWDANTVLGSTRVLFNATLEQVRSQTATVVASTDYAASVWLKGPPSSEITVTLFADSADPPGNDRGNVTVSTLDYDHWRRVTVKGTTQAGEVNAVITVETNASYPSAVYISHAQIEAGNVASEMIETTGTSATRNAQDLELQDYVPNICGSVGFWFFYGGDNTGQTVDIFRTTEGTPIFRIEYTESTNALIWRTIGAGGATVNGTFELKPFAWHHIAVTWAVDSQGRLARALYGNATLIDSDTGTLGTDWDEWSAYPKALIGGTPTLEGSCRYQDMRIDRVAWTAAEVTDIYNRLATQQGAKLCRATVGRQFEIASMREVWLSSSDPDKSQLEIELVESDRDDDVVWTSA